MSNRFTNIILILLFSLLQGACVSAQTRQPATAPTGSHPVLDTAHAPSLEQTLARLADERLLYVGETHTRNADHQLQLAVLRSLPAERAALGVEWFQARFQPVLDDFIAGRIDEAEMLQRTEYFKRWGFDYRLYRPIILYAREHHIPIVALNASRELTDAIHSSGLKGIAEDLKAQLPDEYDYSDKAYDRQLREVFAQHRREDADFSRFLDVQLTWDETMAQNVARYLAEHPQRRMLVLAGRGHIGGRHGIPNRVTRRSGIRGVILGSYQPLLPARTQADYLVLDDEQPLPPRGLMGALLDIEEGVVIKDFTPGSTAKQAGLESGDRILSLDGQDTSDFTRFKLAMLDKRPGEQVSIKVERKGLFGNRSQKTFVFNLGGEAAEGPHAHPTK